MNDSQWCVYGAGPQGLCGEPVACSCTMAEINNHTPPIWIIEELTRACKPRKMWVFACVCLGKFVILVGSLMVCGSMCVFIWYLHGIVFPLFDFSFSIPVLHCASIYPLSDFPSATINVEPFQPLMARFGWCFCVQLGTGWGCVCVWSNCWMAQGSRSACRQQCRSVQ